MVIQKKNWETKQIDEEKVQEIKNKVDIPYFLAKVLSTMDMKIDEIPDFLNPNFEKYKSKDPFLLSGMKESVERILYAIDKKEKIVVFGDSDADGLTGTAILYDFLTKIADKTKIDYYIIDRENEGYGLSDRAVNRVLKKKPNLIITVDCGTTDVEAVEKIKRQGIGVIITDHHVCGQKLPEADGVINPKRDNEDFFRELAGVGVVFELIIALCNKKKLKEEYYLKYTGRVAIGTLADKVKLTEGNRAIVKYGMRRMINKPSLGIKNLIKRSLCNDKNSILSEDIIFELAPRLNAGGNMWKNARKCIELLSLDFDDTGENEYKANEIIDILEQENDKRKEISFDKSKQGEDVSDALEKIESLKLNEDEVIFVGGYKWDKKNLALIASEVGMLSNKIVIAYANKYGEVRVAAKNNGKCDLFNIIEELRDRGLVKSFGGYNKESFGLSVEWEKFKEFKNNLLKIVEENIKTLDAIDNNKSDHMNKFKNEAIEIRPEEITLDNVIALEGMEPFGNANPKPLFLCRRMKVKELEEKGEGKHLSLKLVGENDDNNSEGIDAIKFNCGYREYGIRKGDTMDFVFEMGKYNNKVQMRIKDINYRKRLYEQELEGDKKRFKSSPEVVLKNI